MKNAYIVNGTVKDRRTVILDEDLPVEDGTVQVILASPSETVPNGNGTNSQPRRPMKEVLEEIWEDQRRRGHVPRTREEIDAELRGEKESW